MIIWIASYPKSGNTWIRALLSHYFFSKDEKFNFDLLKHIPNFNIGDFTNVNTKFSSNIDYADKALDVQKFICQKYKINPFFKTHSSLSKIDKKFFTDKSVSLGCIYVVRDPRNVITSYKNHFELTYDDALSHMLNEKRFTYDQSKKDDYSDFQFISSWEKNYQSWIYNKSFPTMIIKYENLLNEIFSVFKNLINFIDKVCKNKTKFNKKKAQNAMTSTSFSKLKKIEEEKGFSESIMSNKSKKKIPFFFLGPENDWKKKIDKNLQKKINSIFKKNLDEFKYIFS